MELNELYIAGYDMLGSAGLQALNADGPEEAMYAIVRGCFDLLGDRQAYLRPESLKNGEENFYVAGVLLVTPAHDYHMLVGNIGFPPEQRRLMIPINAGHPGWVYENNAPLILDNTDDYGEFRQFLKTSRMGSTIFAPMIWQGHFHGQLIMAAQARWTMRNSDLAILVAAARIAAACWIAHDGPTWLNANADPADAFKVGVDGFDES